MISWILGDQTDSPEDHSLADMDSFNDRCVTNDARDGYDLEVWSRKLAGWGSFEDLELRRMS